MDESFGENTGIVVKLINVNEQKIRLNIGRVRLLGARFEKFELSKHSSNLIS